MKSLLDEKRLKMDTKLSSGQIKKIILGLVLSDGHLDNNSRFEFYSKEKMYTDFVESVLSQITGVKTNVRIKTNPRFNSTGYVVYTNKHVYFSKMKEYTYNNRLYLSRYSCSRLNELSFAQIWQSDGYMENNINRKKNKIQNIGWICFDAFPPEELQFLIDRLSYYGISASINKNTSAGGYGYRIRMGGLNLQKFISLIYPYILDCYLYKTKMYYKSLNSHYVNMSLPSAEQYLIEYKDIEDIVRSYGKP